MAMKTKEKFCELCNQRALLYCAADSAFLCRKCDAAVHHANFLVARHRRHLLCSDCNRFTGIHISGTATTYLDGGASPICRSCSPLRQETNPADENIDFVTSPSSSSSSACVSSSHPRATTKEKTKPKRKNSPMKRIRVGSCSSTVTDDEESYYSAAKRKRRRNCDGSGEIAVGEKEEVFVKWIGELGLGLNDGDRDCVVSLASKALSLCLERWKSVVPFKVTAATSFWFSMRFYGICGFATCHNLWRLEVISGVPAKLILHAHAKLARVVHEQRFIKLQEGCDES